MKPDSRLALMELVSYGMEELSTEQAAQLKTRIQECPECAGRWVILEKTLYVLSQTGETEISIERSQKMWLACLEHAKKKDFADGFAPGKDGVMSPSFRSDASHSDASQREGDRRSSISRRSLTSVGNGWLQYLRDGLTPRYGAIALGVAATILVAALLAPSSLPSASLSPSNAKFQALPPSVDERPSASLVSFQDPPHATTGMLNYSAAMGFEPFSDHAAPTLVSTALASTRQVP